MTERFLISTPVSHVIGNRVQRRDLQPYLCVSGLLSAITMEAGNPIYLYYFLQSILCISNFDSFPEIMRFLASIVIALSAKKTYRAVTTR